MSAYNQVPRLTTANPLKMHNRHLGRDSGPPLMAAPDGDQHVSTGQRKWRVLISIGLLLPALAAIIGIVAWTISIEVANGGADQMAAASAMAQLRRDETVAMAAILAARRPRTGQPTTSQPSQPSQLVAAQEQPMSAPLIQAKQQQQRSSAKRSTTRTNQRQHVALAAPAQQQTRRQVKLSESSLVLTNMDQVEALTGSSPTQDLSSSEGGESSVRDEPENGQERTSNKDESNEDKNNRNEEDEPAKAEADQQQAGAQDRNDKTTSSTDSNSSFELESLPSSSTKKPDTVEPNQDSESSSGAAGAGSRTQSSWEQDGKHIEQQKMSADEPDHVDEDQTTNASVKGHRSRWTSSGSGQSGANKRPKMIETVATNKKLVSAKQSYYLNNATRKLAHRPGMTKGSPVARSNSEYKLLASATTDDKLEETQQPAVNGESASASRPEMSSSEQVADCTTAAKQQQQTQKASDSQVEQREPDAANQDEVSFEAIASAISKSLSDNQTGDEEQAAGAERQSDTNKYGDEPARAMAELLSEAIAANKSNGGSSGESSLVPDANASSSLDEEDDQGDKQAAMTSNDDSQTRSKRRRTTGEHLAEVIDHIVEKRNHQRQARFGERSSSLDSHRDDQHHEGPQIVVVAPVGPSGALLKARSLTREQPVVVSTTTSATKLSQVPSSQASGKSESKHVAVSKKSTEPVKKQQQQSKRTRVGGRLLGIDGAGLVQSDAKSEPQTKYSERVEVIEDDDSSALLNSQPMVKPQQGEPVTSADDDDDTEDNDERDEREFSERNQMIGQNSDSASINQEQLSSVHVSSHSGEPRSRSPRHESGSGQMFERYAPMPQEQQQQHNQRQAPARHFEQQRQQQQQKLYSAEQLIMEHVLKSKTRSTNGQQQQGSNQQKPSDGKQGQEATSTTPASTTTTSTTSTTTGQPPAASAQGKPAGPSPSRPQQQQQQVGNRQQSERASQSGEQQLQIQLEQQANFANMQSVQVPALFIQQSRNQLPQLVRFNQYQQQQFQNLQDPYQTMESQQQQQQVQMVSPYESAEQAAQATSQQQAANPAADIREREQQQQQHQNQNQHNHNRPGQQLPVFADQEIQVPAHMAESVIRDLQQAPSTVTGMLNGQPALFQAQPTMMAQVPQQTPHHHQNQHLGQQQMMMQQQQNHRLQHQMNLAESYQRPMIMASEQQQQQPQHQSYLRQALGAGSYSPLGLMSRLASARSRQHEQQQQQQQMQMHSDQMQQLQQMQRERQVLASRASGAKDEQAKQQLQQEESGGGSLIDSVKALGPKGLIQPVAQMALKNLLSSLSQQAAAQQAQADALEQRRHQQRSSPAAMQPPQQPQTDAYQSASHGESIQASGSSPVGAMAVPPAQDQVAASRSMRSLPIGAQAPAGHNQLQSIGGDQEVQESYGQMPAYHMPPGAHYGGGGGGGHYAPDNYQGDHDKKTKGITFHFGGGPIGGGTQLITSPMGIFKHLMIPLLPNPRVNLNGKVVFGVVLEKSTAFGPPTKKKHKFWG